jgi:tetratricopeptide (TPR) repeat protein
MGSSWRVEVLMRLGTSVVVVLLAVGACAEESDGLATADAVFNARRYAEARELYVQVAERAEGATRVEALAQVARCELLAERKDEGRVWLDKAREAADEEEPLGWSRYLGVRGRFEWKDEELEKAKATFVAMYAYCEEHGLHDRAVDAAHMVAIVGDAEDQVAWAHKGIAAAEAGGFEGWLGPLWNNLGWTHEHAGRHEEALDAYRKARHYHWKTGGEVNKLAADWAVGHTLRLLGRHDEARQWLRPVLAWAERRSMEAEEDVERAEWIGHACRDLGLAAFAQGRRDEARELLGRAHTLLAAVDMASWDAEGWKEIVEARESLADGE